MAIHLHGELWKRMELIRTRMQPSQKQTGARKAYHIDIISSGSQHYSSSKAIDMDSAAACKNTDMYAHEHMQNMHQRTALRPTHSIQKTTV